MVSYNEVASQHSQLVRPCDYDLEKIIQQEEFHKQELRQNKDVPEHVRLLFKEISKTYEAQWVGQDIVIHNINIVISHPYDQDSCRGDQEKSLERIKKVIY